MSHLLINDLLRWVLQYLPESDRDAVYDVSRAWRAQYRFVNPALSYVAASENGNAKFAAILFSCCDSAALLSQNCCDVLKCAVVYNNRIDHVESIAERINSLSRSAIRDVIIPLAVQSKLDLANRLLRMVRLIGKDTPRIVHFGVAQIFFCAYLLNYSTFSIDDVISLQWQYVKGQSIDDVISLQWQYVKGQSRSFGLMRLDKDTFELLSRIVFLDPILVYDSISTAVEKFCYRFGYRGENRTMRREFVLSYLTRDDSLESSWIDFVACLSAQPLFTIVGITDQLPLCTSAEQNRAHLDMFCHLLRVVNQLDNASPLLQATLRRLTERFIQQNFTTNHDIHDNLLNEIQTNSEFAETIQNLFYP